MFNNYTKLNTFNSRRASVRIKRFLAKKKFYRKPRRFLLMRRFSNKNTGKNEGKKLRRKVVRRKARHILRRVRPLFYFKLKFASRLLRMKPLEIKRNLISKFNLVTENSKLLTKKLHKYITSINKTKNLKKKLKTKVVNNVFRKFKR